MLFGAVNPSGRLPVSWPKLVGDQPLSYDQLPGANTSATSKYDPAYAFGHGLSYTTFVTSGLSAAVSQERVVARFTVANTGSRAGTVVVPVYVHQPVSPVLVPEKRLVGCARVDLSPGESRSAEVTFSTRQLAVTSGDVDSSGRREVRTRSWSGKAGFTVR